MGDTSLCKILPEGCTDAGTAEELVDHFGQMTILPSLSGTTAVVTVISMSIQMMKSFNMPGQPENVNPDVGGAKAPGL